MATLQHTTRNSSSRAVNKKTLEGSTNFYWASFYERNFMPIFLRFAYRPLAQIEWHLTSCTLQPPDSNATAETDAEVDKRNIYFMAPNNTSYLFDRRNALINFGLNVMKKYSFATCGYEKATKMLQQMLSTSQFASVTSRVSLHVPFALRWNTEAVAMLLATLMVQCFFLWALNQFDLHSGDSLLLRNMFGRLDRSPAGREAYYPYVFMFCAMWLFYAPLLAKKPNSDRQLPAAVYWNVSLPTSEPDLADRMQLGYQIRYREENNDAGDIGNYSKDCASDESTDSDEEDSTRQRLGFDGAESSASNTPSEYESTDVSNNASQDDSDSDGDSLYKDEYTLPSVTVIDGADCDANRHVFSVLPDTANADEPQPSLAINLPIGVWPLVLSQTYDENMQFRVVFAAGQSFIATIFFGICNILFVAALQSTMKRVYLSLLAKLFSFAYTTLALGNISSSGAHFWLFRDATIAALIALPQFEWSQLRSTFLRFMNIFCKTVVFGPIVNWILQDFYSWSIIDVVHFYGFLTVLYATTF
jgi:hypothetical protein